MKLRSILFSSFILLLLATTFAQPARAQDDEIPVVLVLRADGAVTSTMAGYFERGIRRAEREGAEAVVIILNTPGGSVDITLNMVQSMRNSSVPIVVFVAPRGAMAASAGTVLTLAGHVGAMAPQTAIGAASPVGMQGEDIDETSDQKIKEILRATMRSLAEDRPPEAIALAEDTIETARAVSSQEALDIGLIDFIADDVYGLLGQLDGHTVSTIFETRPLNTANAQVEEVPNTFIERVLGVLTNPNIVFLLLTIGVQSILIELSNPGGWLPGFIGVASLALAIYGLGVLPVNWFGLLFLVLAFVLFFLEFQTPTHGVLTVAGIGSFILGALVLFNSVEGPGVQPVSVPLVIVTALLTAGTVALALTFAVRAQRSPIHAGVEVAVGRSGTVQIDLDPRGQVQMGGELWSAELMPGEAPIPKGERVEVVEVRGLRLRVRRM
jgi:membrane-bound serine protease (ClpP class)